MRRYTTWSLLIGPYCVALAACAGSGNGLDISGRPGGPGGPLTATYPSIQEVVFTPICSVCHAGGAAPQGLRLDAVNSYSLLVGVPSTEASSILRVKPGDPDNSYLVQKIEGHAAVGAQMPLGGPPLPAATIAVIRQWVTDGALRPAAASGAHAFGITAVAPAPGDVVLETPMRIVIGLSRELDATRLDDFSLRLERLATGSGQTTDRRVPIDVAVPAGNRLALVVTPRQLLADGRYRLVIPRTSDTGLSDIAGERLYDGRRDVALTEFAVEAGQ
jgi:hypothetical protein